MARYDTYTANDDRIKEDIDLAFIGFNNRLRPDQLTTGILSDSKNGRMEQNGEWQTRKGVKNKLAPLSTGVDALTLPFSMFSTANPKTALATPGTVTVANSDITYASSATINGVTGPTLKFTTNFSTASGVSVNSTSLNGTTLTINVGGTTPANGHGLAVGSIIEISGATVGSGTNPNGFRSVVSIVDDNNFTISVTGIAVNPGGTITYKVYLSELQVKDSTNGGSVLTLSGMDTAGVSPNGVVTVVARTQTTASSGDTSLKFVSDFTVFVTGLTGKGSSAATLATPSLSDGLVNEIYGSCTCSDPNAESESYIVLVANTKAIAVKVSDTTVTNDITFAAAETVSGAVDIIQTFNKLFLFRKGQTPLSIDISTNNLSADQTAQVNSNALVVGKTYKIHTVGSQTWTNCGAANNNEGTIFVCTAVGNQTDAKATEYLELQKVDSGTYSQPVPISITDLDIDSGIATATVSSTSTLARGNTLTVTATNSTIPIDTVITVDTVDSATVFKFVTNVADQTSKTATVEKEVSEGLGFSHMPAPEYGIYHQKRLAVPYRFSVSASDDTYVDRKIYDEILLSDILDTDTYDQIFGQFRFNAGKADFNVGMLSFSDDKLIVFNRNSIHLVDGSENLSIATVKLLTEEVGLVAKDSIVQVGNQILFLSDNGVYGLNFLDLYNLRGNEQPLSESIQKTINTINKEHSSKASAVYFDNKYYIAVPTGDSQVNNTLLVYSFLNKSWESIDNVNNVELDGSTTFSKFEYTKLLVAGEGESKGIYVTNTDGGIHRLESENDGIDRVITDIGTTTDKETRVQGSATTRMFILNSIDRKKFNNFELHLQSGSDESSDVSISANTENIDSEPPISLKKASDYLGSLIGLEDDGTGEDVSIRGRIGNKRAYGLQMTLESILGRPRYRSVKVAGAETYRSTSSVQ